jgi:hypothetical protein
MIYLVLLQKQEQANPKIADGEIYKSKSRN